MCHSRHQPQWLLLLACYLLWPSLLFGGTHSTPVQPARRGRGQPCAHNSIAELIKKSPVIVKALGAHIFSDEDGSGYANDLSALVAAAVNGNGADQPRWQNLQSNFLTSATLLQPSAAISAAAAATATATTTPTTATGTGRGTAWRGSESATRLSLAAGVAASGKQPESILITLTPETIYKGASLLKMTPGAESAARSSSGSGGGGGGSSGSNRAGSAASYGSSAAESAYQYEGQLNATLQPLSCFDGNLLKILPTELIAFGKLVTVQQKQHQPQPSLTDPQQQQQQQSHAAQPIDILYISINGLHRWTPQFENHIWQHLGWDDWSDFTLCSVTCGKGVQQRFRRCLLDNPMVNLNMQLNLNTVNADDDDVDADADNDDDTVTDDDDVVDADVAAAVAVARDDGADTAAQVNAADGINGPVLPPNASNGCGVDDDAQQSAQSVQGNAQVRQQGAEEDVAVANCNDNAPLKANLEKVPPPRTNPTSTTIAHSANSVVAKVVAADDGEVMRTFEGNFDDSMENEWTQEKSLERRAKAKRTQRQRKRRKSTKNYSTMFCEGYNIEQRNCNTFECSDDISDLLKFYKKFPLPEDAATNLAAMQSLPTDANTAATMGATASAVTELLTATVDTAANVSAMTAGAVSATAAGSTLSGTNANAAVGIVTLAGVGASALPSSTPANMGYIRSWRNALNFTIMLTLRVKNDSQATATIFSIRNATHNLYLESCTDGLRLYLERDSTTEMLPVKFNLYDYRWHQVAISIQNGDFISIYVDCSWTNSFVVSKRLYSLPLDADVEIGRGFNGEMQQLLVLPDNQERHQCSNKRTSINEVKRYIIDTFIDDYGN